MSFKSPAEAMLALDQQAEEARTNELAMLQLGFPAYAAEFSKLREIIDQAAKLYRESTSNFSEQMSFVDSARWKWGTLKYARALWKTNQILKHLERDVSARPGPSV